MPPRPSLPVPSRHHPQDRNRNRGRPFHLFRQFLAVLAVGRTNLPAGPSIALTASSLISPDRLIGTLKAAGPIVGPTPAQGSTISPALLRTFLYILWYSARIPFVGPAIPLFCGNRFKHCSLPETTRCHPFELASVATCSGSLQPLLWLVVGSLLQTCHTLCHVLGLLLPQQAQVTNTWRSIYLRPGTLHCLRFPLICTRSTSAFIDAHPAAAVLHNSRI